MTLRRPDSVILIVLGFLFSLALPAWAWKHGVGAASSLAFNSGAQSRGIMLWAPAGVAPFGCNPSTCYTGGGGVAGQLPSAKMAVLTGANVGHVRYGIDPSPILADPTNTAAYVTSAFLGVDLLLNAGIKVVINNAPSTSWPGWTEDDIADGGPTSPNFLAYISYLQTMATHVAANPTLYTPATTAFSVFNETPFYGNVTGGITAQYQELIAMYQAVRAILPNHTIILCLSSDCNNFTLTGFSAWNAADFDGNTMIDVHAYMPPAGAFACQPNTEWRDLCGAVTYPPSNLTSDYNTALAAYSANLAADNTWASDCPSGTNCTAARSANLATMTSAFGYDGLKCYYGQGSGVFPCPAGQSENSAWLSTLFGQITAWLPSGVSNKQIYIGEFGANGTTTYGTGLATVAQTALLNDVSIVMNSQGFSWAVLETNYSSSFIGGSGFGMLNQSSPYALINPSAMAALFP